MRELLLIGIILACPLMMMLMMRGGHGHGGHAHGHGGCGHGHGNGSSEPKLAAELRRERDKLERLIEEREVEESTPGSGRWR
jgi:hypothetical protein